jgi:GNAT superfamily N-acetyltransferase
MLQVQSATRAMVPEIAALMAQNFGRDENLFARLIAVDWGFGFDEIGKVLCDGPKIVGFFGLHHSLSRIRGKEYRITAMHGVAVDKAYRGRGTQMMTQHAVNIPGANYIAWTANAVMDKFYRRNGFHTQNPDACIVLPGTSPASLLAWPFLRRVNVAAFEAEIDPRVGRIFADHRGGLFSEHLFLAFGKPLGLIIRRTYIDRKHPVAELAYVNDATLLRRVFEPVRLIIHRRTRTVAMKVNPAEIGFVPALSRKVPGQYIYKSDTLGPGDFNLLYGELMFLG